MQRDLAALGYTMSYTPLGKGRRLTHQACQALTLPRTLALPRTSLSWHARAMGVRPMGGLLLANTTRCIPSGDAPAAAASTGTGTGSASATSLSPAAAGRTAAVPVAAAAYTPYRCAPRHAKEAQGLLANAGAYLEDAEASRC